jgi:hypothetical protein
MLHLLMSTPPGRLLYFIELGSGTAVVGLALAMTLVEQERELGLTLGGGDGGGVVRAYGVVSSHAHALQS